MKTLIPLSILIALSGCSLSFQRLPDPVNQDLAVIVDKLVKDVNVLGQDYNQRLEAAKAAQEKK